MITEKILYALISILIITESIRGYPDSDNLSTPIFSKNDTYDTFRTPPVIKIRPLNDIIEIYTNGLIELYIDNPSINDVVLNVDIRMSVPSGIHVLGEGFGEISGAGTVYGKFSISPGNAKTIYINIRPEKTGKFFVQLDAIYWPGNNKTAYQQIVLTHDFRSIEITPAPTPKPMTTKEFLQILNRIADFIEKIIRIFEDIRRGTEH